MSSFSQPDKATTREHDVINFGGYFIYGGHFMNRQCQHNGVRHQTCTSDCVTTLQATFELDRTNSGRKYKAVCRYETLFFVFETDPEFI